MSGTLFIVATPIGNLEDITIRALRVLKEVDLVACEDTRHTRTLLSHFAIGTRTISYHDHNARQRAPELLARLEAGENIALVSDAGTPGISDPGFRLVTGAVEQGISVVPIPGPSALVAAASASGMEIDTFCFLGFLPHKTNARRRRLEELASERATLVFYEAPHRIEAMLADALEIFGDRRAVIARELTKLHEEFLRGSLSELVERLDPARRRGEFVVLIEGGEPAAAVADVPIPERVAELEAAGISRMDAIKEVARERGMSKREVYKLLL